MRPFPCSIQGFRVLQNNKALKLVYVNHTNYNSFRVLQNNKALKQAGLSASTGEGFRVLQNNKALKPQNKDKSAYRRTVIL